LTLRVVLLGMPRSATTYVYVRLCSTLKGHVMLFEPFNGDVVLNMVEAKGIAGHDEEGYVPHGFFELPDDLYMAILDNARWTFEWASSLKPSVPFLGHGFWEIMESLDFLDRPVALKDVYAWVVLDELVEMYPKALFIVTHRDLESHYNAFMGWYRRLSPWRLLLRKAFRAWRLIVKPRGATERVRRVREAYERLRNARSPLNLYTLGLFYRYFTGEALKRASPGAVREALKVMHNRYEEMLKRVEGRDNVIILRFEGRLPEEEAMKAVNKAVEWSRRFDS